MIEAFTDIDSLARRLRTAAQRLGDKHTQRLSVRTRQSRADWHSPASLWPDLGME
ncbi:hypothetical protein NAP1_12123 [Erythrobacter sp. NAP1]|uniref:hypothetical protein n=1 Tax=Erythrobacter sp. NAP1 TaxID=237727 RepID=UPI00006879D1|nr:hypothetical protein [Erythrobacter sp. NAP1]EAQ28342.1 hypothetical protein NAP1_12123 [Erythrobacter sp. NAP1]